jgi:hypothetical protein
MALHAFPSICIAAGLMSRSLPRIPSTIPLAVPDTLFASDLESNGIRVLPRTDDIPAWEWTPTLTGRGCAGDLQPMGNAKLAPKGSCIEDWHGPRFEGAHYDPCLDCRRRSVPHLSEPHRGHGGGGQR